MLDRYKALGNVKQLYKLLFVSIQAAQPYVSLIGVVSHGVLCVVQWYCCAVEDQSWGIYRSSEWYKIQPGIPGLSLRITFSSKSKHLIFFLHIKTSCPVFLR